MPQYQHGTRQMAVMISYRSSDDAVADEIYGDLRKRGIDVWIDKVGIRPGAIFRDELLHQLRTCNSCVPVLSPAYVSSEYCRMEVFIARSLGKNILPIMVEDCVEALQKHEETRALYDIFMLRLHRLNIVGLAINREEGLSRLADAIQRAQAPVPSISGFAYISYTLGDAEFATSLARSLNSFPVPTWVATLDCYFGDHWREAQAKAMMNASAHVVVLDENMIKNNDILRTEVLLSEAVGNPVFPVVPPRLSNDHSAIVRIRDSLDGDAAHKTYRRLAARHFFSTEKGEKAMIQLLASELQGVISQKIQR